MRPSEPIGEMAARRDIVVIGNTHLAKGAKATRTPGCSIAWLSRRTPGRSTWLLKTPTTMTGDCSYRRRATLDRQSRACNFTIDSKTVDRGKDISGSFVVWGAEAVTTTADAALAAMDNRDREPTTIDAAADFLSLYLADGPKPSADVIEASRGNGHSDYARKKAQAKLKIKSQKSGLTGWEMALPN